MQNFIVLGYVPGTQFQITFGIWLLFTSILMAIITIYHERYAIKALVLSWLLGLLIKRKHLA